MVPVEFWNSLLPPMYEVVCGRKMDAEVLRTS